MTNILFVSSSPRGDASHSRTVAAHVLDELRRAHPHAKVVVRDLARHPLPHIDETFVSALGTPAEQRTPQQADAIARSDALVDELLAADIVVIGAAMINFSITSTLKTWLDHLARAGRTFRYTPEGHPQGLVTGKRVFIIQAKGGIYSGDLKPFDFLDPYLRHMLGFMGMTDVHVIDVEGTIFGDEAAQKAVEHGRHRATHLIGNLAAA